MRARREKEATPIFAPLSAHVCASLDRVVEAFLEQEGHYPSHIKLGRDNVPFPIPHGHKLVYQTPGYSINIEWIPGSQMEIS